VHPPEGKCAPTCGGTDIFDRVWEGVVFNLGELEGILYSELVTTKKVVRME